MEWQGWGMEKEGMGGEAFWFSLPAGSETGEECPFKHLEPPELPCLSPACLLPARLHTIAQCPSVLTPGSKTQPEDSNLTSAIFISPLSLWSGGIFLFLFLFFFLEQTRVLQSISSILLV